MSIKDLAELIEVKEYEELFGDGYLDEEALEIIQKIDPEGVRFIRAVINNWDKAIAVLDMIIEIEEDEVE